VNDRALDALQSARTALRRPVAVLSAYRSPIHNARVGGAPRSRHLFGDAFDIRRSGHNDRLLYDALVEAGFTGFGFYQTFIHADLGRPRQWGQKWDSLI
jgi:uncharacterized protein YcbK (DUF882 family)